MKSKEFWIKISAIEGPINDPNFTCQVYTEPKPGCTHLIEYGEFQDAEMEISRLLGENRKIKSATDQHLIDSAIRYMEQQDRIDELYKHNRALRRAAIEAEGFNQRGGATEVGKILQAVIAQTKVKQLEPLDEWDRSEI